MLPFAFGYRPARDVCPRSADAARLALELDGTLAEAHASLGFVNLSDYWDLGTAERELNAAVRLDSTYANGHLWLNHLAWARGDTNGAIAHARKAATLEPLSPIHNSRLGIALWRAGKLEEAIEQLRYTLELDSSFIDARRALGLVQLDRGEYDDAIAEMRRTGQPTWIAYAMARAGRREEAERMTRELEETRRGGQWVAPIMLAYIHTAWATPIPHSPSSSRRTSRGTRTWSSSHTIPTSSRFARIRGLQRFSGTSRRGRFGEVKVA